MGSRKAQRAAIAAGLELLLPCLRTIWLSRLPTHASQASERRDIEPSPISILPPVLTQCPVREARNADGRAAVNAGKEKTAVAAVCSTFMWLVV